MEQHIFPDERCVMCGAVISEGRQVCRDCERAILERERQAQQAGRADRDLSPLGYKKDRGTTST